MMMTKPWVRAKWAIIREKWYLITGEVSSNQEGWCLSNKFDKFALLSDQQFPGVCRVMDERWGEGGKTEEEEEEEED